MTRDTTNMLGTVVVSAYKNVRIHTYVSPPDGFSVNTQIVEGQDKLVIFDAQLLNPYAAEVADHASRLAKPVDRIVISHGHPDHWAGLEIVAARFPSAPVFALPGVIGFIRVAGDTILAGLRQRFADRVASRTTIPGATLAPGEHTIAGVRFEFREVAQAESDVQLVALMPDQKVMLAFDLVFAPTDHLFTVVPHFDHWINVLDSLKELRGYEKIFIGHNQPTDRSAYDPTAAYLRTAKECYANASDGASYATALKAAFPERSQAGWADFSGSILLRQPKQS